MNLKKILIVSFFWLSLILSPFFSLSQQSFSYKVSVQAINWSDAPGLHSFVFGQHQGKWLIVGGREDGLHARQPFAAFPESHNNKTIYVIDPLKKKKWSSPIDVLPQSIQEQIQATNINFHQVKDTLYLIGGYGFSQTNNSHKTHPFLTTIQVSKLMDAVINSSDSNIKSSFKQSKNEVFRNTGGQLEFLEGVFYLVGGQNFDGRYNPMGHNTYTQEYITSIQKFKINNSKDSPLIFDYQSIKDPIHLRRRDYNLLPQIFPNGEKGFMISSGVFQKDVDLPFLYPVDIRKKSYEVRTEFNQYLSCYHSAKVGMYDSSNQKMHSLFLGGMSQYYYEGGQLTKDDKVPFVNTISLVSRSSNNELEEFKLSDSMPSLIGASSEFIHNYSAPYYDSKILKLNELSQDSSLIGYVYGGIQSNSRNPFSSNNTSSTKAINKIYGVYLIKLSNSSYQKISNSKYNSFSISKAANSNYLNLKFSNALKQTASYTITNIKGQIIQSGGLTNTQKNTSYKIPIESNEGIYIITVNFDSIHFASKKFIN